MTQNKTVQTNASVEGFIASIAHPTRQQDAGCWLTFLQKPLDLPPKCGGTALLGLVSIIIGMPQVAKVTFWRLGFRRANQICRFT